MEKRFPGLKKSNPLKQEFLLIFLLTAIAPFLLSLPLLWLIISNANENTVLAEQQVSKNMELDLLDTFQKVRAAGYVVALSKEIKEYFQSTIDTEAVHAKQLLRVVSQAQEKIPYKDTTWQLLGSRGNVLLNMYGNPKISTAQSTKLVVPTTYGLNKETGKLQNSLGSIVIYVPLTSIQAVFPKVLRIDNLSANFDSVKLHTVINSTKYKTNLYLLYLYIFVSFLCICTAIYLAIKIIQIKIIDKILSLKNRVQQEIRFESQITSTNEIDALNETFTEYNLYIEHLQLENKKSAQLAAIGNLAHMIAHDVRKPFTSFKIFLAASQHCKSFPEVQTLLDEFSTSLKHSYEYIDTVLADIMDANINKLHFSNDVAIEQVLEKTFDNLAHIPTKMQVNITYNFTHTHYLQLDAPRINRVFVNILSNALEAMRYHGNIWVNTKEIIVDNNHFMEICLGNSNSYIDPQNIPHLFEPFFTSGKENGTGIGLSVAQNVINLHNGNIKCRSNKNTGVEFIINIPITATARAYTPSNAKLPKNLSGSTLGELVTHTELGGSASYTIVIIDDDPLYCKQWQRKQENASILTFLSPEDFLNFINANLNFYSKITAIISDYYFGPSSNISFKQLATKIRSEYKNKFFLASDVHVKEPDFLQKHDIMQVDKKIYTLAKLTSM